MIQIRENRKKHNFWAILGQKSAIMAQNGRIRFFSKNPASSLFKLDDFTSSCKKSENSNEPILRKALCEHTYIHSENWKFVYAYAFFWSIEITGSIVQLFRSCLSSSAMHTRVPTEIGTCDLDGPTMEGWSECYNSACGAEKQKMHSVEEKNNRHLGCQRRRSLRGR